VNDVSKMSLEASDSTTSRGGDRGIDNTPRLDRIARRAHEIYEARGGADGRNVEDWLQAEREIDDAAGLQEVPPRLISER
jgi:hypothetical protein